MPLYQVFYFLFLDASHSLDFVRAIRVFVGDWLEDLRGVFLRNGRGIFIDRKKRMFLRIFEEFLKATGCAFLKEFWNSWWLSDVAFQVFFSEFLDAIIK